MMDDKKNPLTPDEDVTKPLTYDQEPTRGTEDAPAPPDIVIEN